MFWRSVAEVRLEGAAEQGVSTAETNALLRDGVLSLRGGSMSGLVNMWRGLWFMWGGHDLR